MCDLNCCHEKLFCLTLRIASFVFIIFDAFFIGYFIPFSESLPFGINSFHIIVLVVGGILLAVLIFGLIQEQPKVLCVFIVLASFVAVILGFIFGGSLIYFITLLVTRSQNEDGLALAVMIWIVILTGVPFIVLCAQLVVIRNYQKQLQNRDALNEVELSIESGQMIEKS